MNFVDDVVLTIAAGNGGDGLMHLRREKYNPHGGPDGGDGGRGGSVYVAATNRRQTLAHVAGTKTIKANAGQNGGVNLRSGKSGDDVIIDVPVGTVVTNVDTEEQICDVVHDGERVCIAKGGTGGRGNWHFRSATNQAPEEFEHGTKGETLKARITVKLVADIGLVGQPNAGKSTLLNVLTNATSKVGAYPFTTTNPHLGVLRTSDRDIVIADIPGLIEGAAEGKGLGHTFLRHIERTRVITYMIPADSANPKKELQGLQNELRDYDAALLSRPALVVITKSDLAESAQSCEKALRDTKLPLVSLSAHTHLGLDELVKIWQQTLDKQ